MSLHPDDEAREQLRAAETKSYQYGRKGGIGHSLSAPNKVQAPITESNIGKNLAGLSALVQDIRTNVIELENRIEPILLPIDSNEGEVEPEITQSMLAKDLQSICHDARAVLKMLSHLYNRIDL